MPIANRLQPDTIPYRHAISDFDAIGVADEHRPINNALATQALKHKAIVRSCFQPPVEMP